MDFHPIPHEMKEPILMISVTWRLKDMEKSFVEKLLPFLLLSAALALYNKAF